MLLRSLSYAANQTMPNGNKDKPFTIERGVVENYHVEVRYYDERNY